MMLSNIYYYFSLSAASGMCRYDSRALGQEVFTADVMFFIAFKHTGMIKLKNRYFRYPHY